MSMPTRPRFIGTKLKLPKRGDEIKILFGEHEGCVFKVVRVDGSAYYTEGAQVVVELDGEEGWLHPWEIMVVE